MACVTVQAICILLYLINQFCLGSDTFVFALQRACAILALLTCWVWFYGFTKLVRRCVGESKWGRFLMWSGAVVVFFVIFLPAAFNHFFNHNFIGCEYGDSQHEILVRMDDYHFPFSPLSLTFVYFKKGFLIDHYLGETVGYYQPDYYSNKQWTFYDELGVAVLTADRENNNNDGYLSEYELYEFDAKKVKSHEKEIAQLEQRVFSRLRIYDVYVGGYYLKNGFETRAGYNTQTRMLEQYFFSDDNDMETPNDRQRHLSKADNDSILACIRSLPLKALPTYVGQDDSINMRINDREVTSQQAKPNPTVRKKVMWLFNKLK